MSLPPLPPPTPPQQRASDPPAQSKLRALEAAAAASRTPFSTLVSIARAESNFDVNAQNRRSSAAGPFQMTERTWLQLVKRYGAEAGRADLAALVGSDAKGFATVNAENRREVLDARRDMDLAAKLAARLCDENRTGLARKLGREPSEAEVRMAYFLGLNGAARLITASDATPDKSVKSLLPQAYANHRPMFTEAGRPLTVERAADALEARFTRQIAQAAVPATAKPRTAALPLPLPPAPRPADGPAVLVAAMETPPAESPAVTPAPAEPASSKPLAPSPTRVASSDGDPKELDCEQTDGGVRCTL